MLFNSYQFLVFFPLVTCAYFLCPVRVRWALMLAASYYFYMSWRWDYIFLIMTATLVAWSTALGMGSAKSPAARRWFFLAGVIINLSLLFVFKYFNFAMHSLQACLDALGVGMALPMSTLVLPVGISFFTFQALGYTFDVYAGRQKPERHPGYFGLYISFFPQLVAGPIERAENLLPELRAPHSFDYRNAVEGMQIALWGMFKKVVVADRLAVFVNSIYNSPTDYPGFVLAMATVCFAFQIYCDFSGYSEIAIGCARVMGIHLMTNFDRPYSAKSIPEFWKRWHISLSTWFRDYVYFSLGGNRISVRRGYINALIVFVLSGLWHGASWTFVLWGLFHGICYVSSRLTSGLRERCTRALGFERVPRLHALLQQAFCFVLVCIGWVFFRANSVSDAFYILTHLFSGLNQFTYETYVTLDRISVTAGTKMEIMGAVLAFVVMVEHMQPTESIRSLFARRPAWIRWGAYAALALAIMNLGVSHEIPFVYFQF